MALMGESAGPLPLPPKLGQGPEGEMPSGPPDPAGGETEGLLRLIFQVDQALDTIARQFPGVADKIDTVKTSLDDVIATATRDGAAPPKKRGLTSMMSGMSGGLRP